MCLLIVLSAAILATIIFYFHHRKQHLHLDMLCLMYWGASLMWTVDGFFCLMEGEAFLDISKNDACLGLLVVLVGLGAWGILVLRRGLKKTHVPTLSKN